MGAIAHEPVAEGQHVDRLERRWREGPGALRRAVVTAVALQLVGKGAQADATGPLGAPSSRIFIPIAGHRSAQQG
jgi:hypothetical protein